ncbi:MAG: hypothetical protein WC712_09985 [Candidatus Brocadiia bacterium]
MKTFKTIAAILVFLGVIFAIASVIAYKVEKDRWLEFKSDYDKILRGEPLSKPKVSWSGRILEFDRIPDRKETYILVQAYKFGHPAEPKYCFYGLAIGEVGTRVEKGDLVEVSGTFKEITTDGRPIIYSQYFDKWFYPFPNLGLEKWLASEAK